ncbi:hypothetical protein CES85_5641 [Ochrobactrum quorumnocens]|uniref:Uncharacterized protein n=1 Tax=Ochrobactrum quorumnocens TaxID=271865 RepID=A0A248UDD9_9HYPH|nr:hypothetical protein CES85_5641 [[Ochrobactrum] quorumnocens]
MFFGGPDVAQLLDVGSLEAHRLRGGTGDEDEIFFWYALLDRWSIRNDRRPMGVLGFTRPVARP